MENNFVNTLSDSINNKNRYEMVICRFGENLSWIRNIDIPYNIYNKGEDIEFECIKCPNVGRESETYLRHIIENYDNLPDFLIFLQGDPAAHMINFIDEIKSYIDSESSDIRYLGRVVGEVFFQTKIFSEIVKDYPSLFNHFSSHFSNYRFSQGAEYIVHKERIQSKSLEFWKRLYEIHDSYYGAPWDIERLWHTIFDWNGDLHT
jgi:hypothetical protein